MITLATLFVTSDRIALRWSVEPPLVGNVMYSIWRSGNAINGFEVINETDQLVFVDNLVRGSKFQSLYYYVSVGAEKSPVVAMTAAPGDDVLRLAKRERYQLAKHDGSRALLFARKKSGPRCPRCTIDPVRGDAGINCQQCFGTGFDGGYYAGIPLYLATTELKTEGADLREERVVETSIHSFWTSNWTLVAPEDVLVELEVPNHIWWVTGVERTERRRSPVRQIMSVKEADLGNALGNLPIPQIAWPAREEIFFFDPVLSRDFDTVFQEVLDAARAPKQIPGVEAQSPAVGVRSPYGAGARDPETGIYR